MTIHRNDIMEGPSGGVRVLNVMDVTLAATPNETWANTILGRLAVALGHRFKDGVMEVDPDAILDDAVEHIEGRY